jgi:hypothetical protein
VRTLTVIAAVVCLVALLSSCASPSVTSSPTPKCATGPGKPIPAERMRAALRTAGLATTDDHSLCDRDTVTALVLPNFEMTCNVFQRVVYPTMKRHPGMRFEGPNYSGKAHVIAFENVDCSDYADGSRRDQISAALRRIFRGFGATARTVGRY